MRRDTFSAAGVDIELAILQDRYSRHWLVMARWLTAQQELSTQTMPPLSPELTEEQAWHEAHTWAVKTLMRKMLEAGGAGVEFSTAGGGSS